MRGLWLSATPPPHCAIEDVFLAVQFINVKTIDQPPTDTEAKGLVDAHGGEKGTGLFMLGLGSGKLFGGFEYRAGTVVDVAFFFLLSFCLFQLSLLGAGGGISRVVSSAGMFHVLPSDLLRTTIMNG